MDPKPKISLNISGMVVFKSLIVFDAETTSLPALDHNTTKITEVAFLGCEIEHLKNSESLPRVLHKLVLLFNPNKLIQPEASSISGLTNEVLVNVQPLREEDIDILRLFIGRLPPPVCIVAHNGDNFDFPILRRALQKLNKSLPNNVYCADSIKAFRSLLPKAEHPLWTRRSTLASSNEVTPTHQRTQPVNSLHHNKVCRQLFPDDEALSQWASSQDSDDCTIKHSSHAPKSYKLNDIYYFFFGGYFAKSHRAEEDSKALLSCIKWCDGFFDWINENAIIFNSIQPLF